MLSCKTVVAYCLFQFTLVWIYGSLPTARTYVFKDTLKMPLGTISWVIAAVKSIDVLTGALIGRMSDNTKTRWGQRKPYIALFWPLGAVVMVLLLSAGQLFRPEPHPPPCLDLVPEETSNASCSALRLCLDSAIANGTLPEPLSASLVNVTSTEPRSTTGPTVWLFLFYWMFFTFVVSGSQIPYDALGQELTDDYDERTKLFTWKMVFNLLGGAFGTQVLGAISAVYPHDTAYAALFTYIVTAVLMMITLAVILWGVKERTAAPPTAKQAAKTVPVAAAVRRLLSVKPYRWYLIMRLPMTCLGLLPFQILIYYVQNNLELETVSTLLSMTQIIAIVGAILSIPLMYFLVTKIGRPAMLTGILLTLGTLFVIATFIPFNKVPTLIYALAPFLGSCIAVPYLVPDAMLGDIIDYDELLTGERNEAMYSMVETNVQQLVEVILAAATMCMALAGFTAISGCECGCGVSCEKQVGYKFARWVCPGSIGYSCSDKIGSELYYQSDSDFNDPGGRFIPPCALQNEGVKWVTAIFMFGAPGVCGLLAIFPIRKAMISKEQHTKIIEGIETLKKEPHATVIDPLTGHPVVRPANTEASLYQEQFSVWEWARLQAGNLTAYLGARLFFYVAILVGFIATNVAVTSDALLQVMFWAVAFLIIIVPLDLIRFLAAYRGPPRDDAISLRSDVTLAVNAPL